MQKPTREGKKVDLVRARIRLFAKTYFEYPHLQNLAEACGLNYQHMVNMNDKARPSMHALQAFLEHADMSSDWLISGLGPMRFSERFDADGYEQVQRVVKEERAVKEAALAEAATILEDSRKLHKKIEEVSKLLKKGR